jgi:hypothetical protein
MSSRVEQEQAKQAAEAERLQKKIEKESREARSTDQARESFARLVKGGQQGAQQAERGGGQKGEEGRDEGKKGEEQAGKASRQAEAGERTARMARGGVIHQSRVMEQARSFQGVLQGQQGATQEAERGRVEGREQGFGKDRVDRDDREVSIQRQEQKRDAEAELARLEGREQARANAAIRGDQKGGGDDERGEDGAAALARAKKASTAAAAAEGAKAPREVKQIPPELLEKLVSAVYLGVNAKGLKEFQIELKDGPLKGAFLKITAEDGKVGLRFEGLGADEKRLLEASRGDLMRRLEKKGLALGRFEVA